MTDIRERILGRGGIGPGNVFDRARRRREIAARGTTTLQAASGVDPIRAGFTVIVQEVSRAQMERFVVDEQAKKEAYLASLSLDDHTNIGKISDFAREFQKRHGLGLVLVGGDSTTVDLDTDEDYPTLRFLNYTAPYSEERKGINILIADETHAFLTDQDWNPTSFESDYLTSDIHCLTRPNTGSQITIVAGSLACETPINFMHQQQTDQPSIILVV